MSTQVHKGKTHIFTARDGEQNSVITIKAGQNETLNIDTVKPHYLMTNTNSTVQTISNSTVTEVRIYWSVQVSSSSITYSLGKFTINEDGLYQINYSIVWGAPGTGGGGLQSFLIKNGTRVGIARTYAGSASDISQHFSTILKLVATDVVHVEVFQTTGVSVALNANATNIVPGFSILKVSS